MNRETVAPNPIGFEPGTLVYGVSVDGACHRDFVVGSLSVAEVLALEEEESTLPKDSSRAATMHQMKAISLRLVRLGDLPMARVTPEFLAQNLKWSDALQVREALGRLDGRLAEFRASLARAPEGDRGDERPAST